MKKLVLIEAQFPELKGGKAYATTRDEGSTWPVAAARAMKKLKKHHGRHRVTVIRITLTIMDKIEEVADDATENKQTKVRKSC